MQLCYVRKWGLMPLSCIVDTGIFFHNFYPPLQTEDLIRLGAFKQGQDARADRAAQLKPAIEEFLRQQPAESSDFSRTMEQLFSVISGSREEVSS